jgi:hypothetical protein
MNKKEFDDIFIACKQQLLPLTEEQLIEKLSLYSDENGKIPLEKLAMFAYLESIKYTNDMIYGLLSRVLDISE